MADQDSNLISRILNKILGYVEPVLQLALKTLIEHRPVAFAIAGLFLVTAFAAGYESWQRADFYQRTVERALSKRTENTPQTYKALEALILSNVETDDDGNEFSYRDLVGDATFSPSFASSVKEIHEAFGRSADAPKVNFAIAKPDIAALIPRGQEEAIVTETDISGFLFLPVRLLRVSDDDYSKMGKDASTIAQYLGITEKNGTQSCDTSSKAYPVCDDVITSRRLVTAMKSATGVAVTSDKMHDGIELMPQQVYYITENGMNRIISRGGNDAIVYRNQFRAPTVFPSRPYYSGAFAAQASSPGPLLDTPTAKPTGKLKDYFYVSDPYLDIGGNGLVVTLARALQYQGHNEGVICFDLRLKEKQSLGTKLTDLLDGLKAVHLEITCTTIGDGDPECQPKEKPERQLSDAAYNLEEMLKQARKHGNGSDIIGGFAFVPLGTSPPSSIASIFQIGISHVLHANHELRFMVPLDPPKVLDPTIQKTQLEFLAVSLNIGSYLQNTALIALGAISLLGLSFMILIVAWAGDARKRALVEEEKKFVEEEKRDLHKALDNVSNVMMSSDTPYVRLDDEDRIVNANPSFAGFLGLERTTDSVEREILKTKFEDWITGDVSKRTYHRIQLQRRAGEAVPPYDLEFAAFNNSVVKARVVSSVVPASQNREGSLPETFGILVPL